jgi:hypothetical protein
MRVSAYARLVAMAWEKETQYDRFSYRDTSLDLPGEAYWRSYRRFRNKPPSLPTASDTPTTFWHSLFIMHSLLQQERQELLELGQVRTQIELTTSLAHALGKEGPPEEVKDAILTWLWMAQKTTNPLAIKPIRRGANDMIAQLEQMKSIFEAGPITIKG